MYYVIILFYSAFHIISCSWTTEPNTIWSLAWKVLPSEIYVLLITEAHNEILLNGAGESRVQQHPIVHNVIFIYCFCTGLCIQHKLCSSLMNTTLQCVGRKQFWFNFSFVISFVYMWLVFFAPNETNNSAAVIVGSNVFNFLLYLSNLFSKIRKGKRCLCNVCSV